MTLANKLRIKEGYRIAILHPPKGYSELLGELPNNVTVANSLQGDFDLIQFFVSKRKVLEKELSRLKNALKPTGLLWVSYPKGKQLDADSNRDSIAAFGKSVGLKAVAQVSVDEVWSTLRFKS